MDQENKVDENYDMEVNHVDNMKHSMLQQSKIMVTIITIIMLTWSDPNYIPELTYNTYFIIHMMH